MLKQENNGGGDGGANCNNWSRICDTCRAAACKVYCRTDSAYLCAGCDARIHGVASRHERVLVCEACERAPAAFLCKADAASLCATCDADIHSANPLASRHHRVPIPPISGYGAPAGDERFLTHGGEEEEETMDEEDEEEAASWLLLNPMKNNNNLNNGFLFNGEVDEYLDLMDGDHSQFTDQYSQNQQQYGVVSHKRYGGDSVVPVQCGEGKTHQLQQQQSQHFQLGLDFEPPKTAYSYNASVSQSVSISSMDVGVVPESTMNDVSISHPRTPKGTIDLFSGPTLQLPCQLTPMDREARVLRYREKKKTRKFEKTIRYASRKAYAETRPRIRGRFAKRTNAEAEVDQMFSTTLMTETAYGIVPSF